MPANNSPPSWVVPYPGAPGYEAVATCLAAPEVRAGPRASSPCGRPWPEAFTPGNEVAAFFRGRRLHPIGFRYI